jgi:hypothetical protein
MRAKMDTIHSVSPLKERGKSGSSYRSLKRKDPSPDPYLAYMKVGLGGH